jgi:type IV pilus assembly protein PilB
VLVRFRVDGFLKAAAFQIPWTYRSAVIAKIKIMTNSMNITERRIPQSGRIQVMAKGNPIEFRVEIVPTVYGESVVMRIWIEKPFKSTFINWVFFRTRWIAFWA